MCVAMRLSSIPIPVVLSPAAAIDRSKRSSSGVHEALISPSPSASCVTWPTRSSAGKHDCGPLPHCASSALPSPRHLLPTTLVLEGAGLPQAPRAGFWPSLLLLRLQPDLDHAAHELNHKRYPQRLLGPSPLPDIRRR